jgi:hypothetical protein
MIRTSLFFLAATLTLCATAEAFTRQPPQRVINFAFVHGGTRGPALPQRSCWSHIYNGSINLGHDAALARAEANLICG